MAEDSLIDNPERVTTDRVKEEVSLIRRHAQDGLSLAATELESSLHLAVLAAIGRGIIRDEAARACAALAASTIEICFPRIQQSRDW